MENRNSYFIVGLFFCIVLVFAIFFVLFMKSNGNKDEYTDYYIETKELPSGIKKDSQVKFIGVPVGIVQDIYFSDPKTATIELKIMVKKGLPIKKDSMAIVEIQGITGLANINITKGSINFNPNEKKVIKMGQGILERFSDRAEDLSKKITSSLSKINTLLSDENLNNISSTLKDLNRFSSNLASDENIRKINETISNTNKIISNLNKENLKELISDMKLFLNKATILVESLKDFQDILAKKANDGQFDFKSIVSPTLQNTDDTLNEIINAANEFKNMLFRLENNPYEFFFKDNSKDKK